MKTRLEPQHSHTSSLRNWINTKLVVGLNDVIGSHLTQLVMAEESWNERSANAHRHSCYPMPCISIEVNVTLCYYDKIIALHMTCLCGWKTEMKIFEIYYNYLIISFIESKYFCGDNNKRMKRMNNIWTYTHEHHWNVWHMAQIMKK